MTQFHESLQTFFRNKRLQLLAAAAEADTPHPGLLGAHREALVRNFLTPFLPRRFSVGRGMVFGFAGRSRECDVVIWDADNYPLIDFPEYSHFFAESVRAVIEVKSRYSTPELDDVLSKSLSIRSIVPMPGLNLTDTISMLQLDVLSIKSGVPHEGMMVSKPHIATAAVFLRGGQNFTLSSLSNEVVAEADESWPDLILFLEAGKVVTKRYVDSDDGFARAGYLALQSLDDDSLYMFAADLFAAISERSVQVEDPGVLSRYAGQLDAPEERRRFSLTRFAPSHTPLWLGGE